MRDYKDTLNLPVTEFPMRASLPQKEPEMLKFWEDNDFYHEMLKMREGREKFVLHDGPPFSNGNIHMGTALNKLLKDFICKSKSMSGYYTPYVPGWDNHGMPIESAIIKKNKLDRKKMTVSEFRSQCQKFASDFIDIQRKSFKRLGIFGEWDKPYLTMDPLFEATEIKAFGKMFEKGYIYKSLKPVYWCPHDETALAEAEIEYSDVECNSVYVKFKLSNDNGKNLSSICDTEKLSFIIWTTTPWTLPGNLAIALHPRLEYAVISANGEFYVTAKPLAEKTMAAAKIEDYQIIKTMSGAEFEYMTARHPFLDRESLVVCADYVTAESGTGCVHTAPGYGADDYRTGMKYKTGIIVPVDDKGIQNSDAGKFAGMFYEKSNQAIIDDMAQTGALFASEKLTHSYPHCWRCKNSIIFRATPQWFCSVSDFKKEALAACEKVTWLPSWGYDRINSMINERADWCISRQRHWGLPIPVIYCDDCDEIICNNQTIENISAKFAELGSNAWFDLNVSELLPSGYVCPKCGKSHFTKETDTLDGWFDSGSSHLSVLDNNENMSWPSDMYLEGADQYRGWFQSSLLIAVAMYNKGAPYKSVLTHGWTVDGEGKAMHKSLGNTIEPETVITQYGAEMIRLWVAASDYRVDIRVSDGIFKQLSESYRKIRNTLRILLANLGDPNSDFNPKTDMVEISQMQELDKWAVTKLNRLIKSVKNAYNDYTFHNIYHGIHNFCSIELSKLYVDITKDRLYCEKCDSATRRSAQSAMYMIVNALARLLSPILSFTAEEVWSHMAHVDSENAKSVFLNYFPDYAEANNFTAIESKYDKIFELRDDVMKSLEIARAAGVIGKSLEAKITIYATESSEAMKNLELMKPELSQIFIVSSVVLSNNKAPDTAFTDTASGFAVSVEKSDGEKCVRCWTYYDDCVHDADGQAICRRCRSASC